MIGRGDDQPEMIPWTPALETGHPVIDDDHKKLIASLNELDAALQKGAGKEQVVPLITFLNRYTREHFLREEAHMARVQCPAATANIKAHRDFVAKLDDWVTRLNTGPSLMLVLEVHRETSNWIRAHILSVDCKLRGCRLA
jgi:hemerythrin-like metal-binding protein